ncbi:Serine/threonine-protein kinase AtPK2/AtPK19 [Linum grandiflorum]
MVTASQKNNLRDSLLSTNLKKLTITPPDSTSESASDFDFSDVFGPTTPHPPPNPDPDHDPDASSSSASASSSSPSSALTAAAAAATVDPLVIHNRSHSFVGPSPRFTLSISLPFTDILEEEDDDDGEEDEEASSAAKIEAGVTGVECDKRKEDGGEDGSNSYGRIGPGDFEILRMVGQGAFGKVFLVKRKKQKLGNGDGIFAMKVMRKDNIIKKNHVDYMRAERDILTKVVHPFIVQLRYSFQTKTKLYLILDFINGGHLFFHLYRQRIFRYSNISTLSSSLNYCAHICIMCSSMSMSSEDQARLYAAEIVSAVSHLHDCGIVHRDLKPENILLDVDGHVMLTDFGLAKEIDESSRSNSMCGTTEYMAPEILLAKGHNKDADWWSVGILLYEMLGGQPPYTHQNRKKLQEKIIKEKIKLPPLISSEGHSLLKGLLQKDPSKRLGNGPGGGDDIKHHKWFKSINWKKLEARELQPKFVPVVSGKECTSNFDKCWTSMPVDDSPASTPTAGEHFQGYTYVAPNPWLSSV